jgi:hypothetical protein
VTTLSGVRTALAAATVAACSSTPPPPGPPADPVFPYPQDDTLRLQHLQAKSTHNSYHVETAGNLLDAWHYTHVPLDRQLGEQGVRHVELDLSLVDTSFEVFHILLLDEETTCRAFTDCLAAIKGWSDAHRAHHPITVQIELKDPPQADYEAYFAALHGEIGAVWPPERVITPALVQGEHATLGEAVKGDGWPTLGALRGKVLFTLDNAAEFQEAYTHGRRDLDGRILFAHAAPSDPFAAIAVLNDPVADSAAIAAALEANMLVRTRADSDSVEPLAGDTSRRDAALASGAQFVSTDYPAGVNYTDYFVEIPEGTPSRCNPLTAPAKCTSEAIEDPAFVGP